MRSEAMKSMIAARRMLCLVLIGLFAMAGAASAQDSQTSSWRIGASAGGYVPFTALIKTADFNDTRLAAGPAFGLEPQYTVSRNVSAFGSALIAFPTIRLGSSIRPAVVGPSNQVMLGTASAGVLLSTGNSLRPTLRLGGGLKFYSFDLTDADNQIRPTADVGVGLHAVDMGAIDGMIDIRYLLSAFDQGKLPTRGIETHNHRQNDLVFTVGIGFRGSRPNVKAR